MGRALLSQNEIYWDDWSQLSIFRTSKTSGSEVEVLASQLTGLMDMKLFYKGKISGKPWCLLWQLQPPFHVGVGSLFPCCHDNMPVI